MTGRMWERWQRATSDRYPSPRACKFVSGDDFLRLAVQSYLAAGRDLIPPAGEPWVDEGATWDSAEGFYAHLLDHLGERLRRAALERGDLAEEPWPDEADEPAGAGRSPAAEGHGWPASAAGASSPPLAVGPAPTALGCDITIPGNPLFCGSAVQKLPGVTHEDNLDSEGEKIAC